MAVEYPTSTRAQDPEFRREGGFDRNRHGAGRLPRTPAGGSGGHDVLARALGWFSIAVGLTEALVPKTLGRSIGIGADETTVWALRGLGLREIGNGIGILVAGKNRPTGLLWARVGGDAMDLALLGLALSARETEHARTAAATAAVAGVTALDVLCALQHENRSGPATRTVETARTITINCPVGEVYRFWRDFQNLPRFMSHLDEVRITDGRRSHWRAKGPGGVAVEWDAEITEDIPNERLGWRSLEGADIEHSGAVRFRPAPRGRGTEIRVELRYAPPGGAFTGKMLELLGESPGQQIREELRALKQLMETGEIARSGASFGRFAHAGRPPEGAASPSGTAP